MAEYASSLGTEKEAVWGKDGEGGGEGGRERRRWKRR